MNNSQDRGNNNILKIIVNSQYKQSNIIHKNLKEIKRNSESFKDKIKVNESKLDDNNVNYLLSFNGRSNLDLNSIDQYQKCSFKSNTISELIDKKLSLKEKSIEEDSKRNSNSIKNKKANILTSNPNDNSINAISNYAKIKNQDSDNKHNNAYYTNFLINNSENIRDKIESYNRLNHKNNALYSNLKSPETNNRSMNNGLKVKSNDDNKHIFNFVHEDDDKDSYNRMETENNNINDNIDFYRNSGNSSSIIRRRRVSFLKNSTLNSNIAKLNKYNWANNIRNNSEMFPLKNKTVSELPSNNRINSSSIINNEIQKMTSAYNKSYPCLYKRTENGSQSHLLPIYTSSQNKSLNSKVNRNFHLKSKVNSIQNESKNIVISVSSHRNSNDYYDKNKIEYIKRRNTKICTAHINKDITIKILINKQLEKNKDIKLNNNNEIDNLNKCDEDSEEYSIIFNKRNLNEESEDNSENNDDKYEYKRYSNEKLLNFNCNNRQDVDLKRKDKQNMKSCNAIKKEFSYVKNFPLSRDKETKYYNNKFHQKTYSSIDNINGIGDNVFKNTNTKKKSMLKNNKETHFKHINSEYNKNDEYYYERNKRKGNSRRLNKQKTDINKENNASINKKLEKLNILNKINKISKNSNWKKVSNLIKSIKLFNTINAVPIENLSEVDKDLSIFRKKYNKRKYKENEKNINIKNKNQDKLFLEDECERMEYNEFNQYKLKRERKNESNDDVNNIFIYKNSYKYNDDQAENVDSDKIDERNDINDNDNLVNDGYYNSFNSDAIISNKLIEKNFHLNFQKLDNNTNSCINLNRKREYPVELANNSESLENIKIIDNDKLTFKNKFNSDIVDLKSIKDQNKIKTNKIISNFHNKISNSNISNTNNKHFNKLRYIHTDSILIQTNNNNKLKEEAFSILLNPDECALDKLRLVFQKLYKSGSLDNKNNDSVMNQRNESGKTLLYIACQEGFFEIVDFLLDQKIDSKIKSRRSGSEYESCLAVAVRWKFYNIVKLLLEKGCYSETDINECASLDFISENIYHLLCSKSKEFSIMYKKYHNDNARLGYNVYVSSNNRLSCTSCCLIY